MKTLRYDTNISIEFWLLYDDTSKTKTAAVNNDNQREDQFVSDDNFHKRGP